MRYHSDVYQWFVKHSVFLCFLIAVCPAMANPSGGQVAGGTASIRYGSTTVVTQHTPRAIVNWADFSINPNETTRFVQPSSKSVMLNRVTGSNPSHILGNLTANGQIFLVNPNGIVFGKTARVDVAGLVASTANISNKDFMSGNYHFTGGPVNGKIINEGTITVRNAGLAALVAPSVQNSGVIQARLGRVALASGNAFTVDLYGDNLITFDATSVINHGQVDNLGRIEAAGGTVMLTAGSADNLLENMINMSGYISATSVGKQAGKIILQGYGNSILNVSGTLDVSGINPGEVGGLIQASATTINLGATSVQNANGYFGGGTVYIGGQAHGEGTLAHAQYVNMAAGALINADAMNTGNGGQVVLWSDMQTTMHGSITARGGVINGNGGFIETSSANTVNFVGAMIDTRAYQGISGNWLIDPLDMIIGDAEATTLTAALTTSDVTLTNAAGAGAGDITFTNTSVPVTLSNNHSFTVNAYHDLTLDAPAIQASGSSGNLYTGNITLTAGNDIFINQPVSVGADYMAGQINIVAGNNITFGPSSWSFFLTGIYSTNGTMNSTNGSISLRSDANKTGAGTVIDQTGGQNLVTNDGRIRLYYNPTNFSTPNSYGLLTLDGPHPALSYMLVYNSISGHTLSDAATAVNGGVSGIYALAENVSGLSTPIGTAGNPFTGYFNGSSFDGTINYYTISNVNINTSGNDNVGLFGYVNGATIDNITLLSSSFVGQDNVGSLVGYSNGGLISNSFSTASVSGRNNVGGLVGSSNVGAVLLAGMYSGTINSSGSNVGGLTGFNDATSSIQMSLAIPTIVGGSNVGGAIGNNLSSTLYAVYSGITSGFSGPAIGTGITSGTSPFADALPAASFTSLPTGFNDGAYGTFWKTNGSSNYISLITCGSSCVIPITSGIGLSGDAAKQYVTVEQILNNNIKTTTPTLIYYSDDALMYTVPLATGDGIYVLTVTPESKSDTENSIDSAIDALKSSYGCDTSI